jgi:hypothetical protein
MDRQKVFALNAKHENSEDAKDGNGIYRNCLVCGDNNSACGWFNNKFIFFVAYFQAKTVDFKFVIVAE